MRMILVFTFLASLKIWNEKRLNCVASLMSQIVIRIVMIIMMMIMMTIAVVLKYMIALLTITTAMKVMVRQQLRMGAVSSQLGETQKVEDSCAAKCFPRNN